MRTGLTRPRPRSYNTRCVAERYKLPRWVVTAIRKQAPVYGSQGRAGLPVSGTATVLPASGGPAEGSTLKDRPSRVADRWPLVAGLPHSLDAPGTMKLEIL